MSVGLAALLAACGGDDSSAPSFTADAAVAGVTPFIAFITIHGAALATASSVHFDITPKAGTVSKPVSVTFSRAYLVGRGYATANGTDITIPVFGLYAGATNAVHIAVQAPGSEPARLQVNVVTAPWTDPNAVYDHMTVVQQRAAGSPLGLDFMYLRSDYGTPVIIDTDGNVRWIGTGVASSFSSLLVNNGFVVGSQVSGDIARVELDGTVTHTTLASPDIGNFHHDIEAGKSGLFGDVNDFQNGSLYIESFLDEFQPDGTLLQEWDMNQIIGDFMTANGDDPSNFVRPTDDWFHMNTAIYDKSDDSIIVSSRENFLIKIDYTTHAIRWIFGDTTKYWYTFASLRSKALTLNGGGLVPVGQHSVNFANDGTLLLFNNGAESLSQPAGAPVGLTRTYAAVSDYTIDESTMTAVENWHYDHGQTYDSRVCSSVRQTPTGALLIDYASNSNDTAVHLVGLDPMRNVAFDYKYPNTGCRTSWNTQPIALDDLQFN